MKKCKLEKVVPLGIILTNISNMDEFTPTPGPVELNSTNTLANDYDS
jgi:hypothetical protein